MSLKKLAPMASNMILWNHGHMAMRVKKRGLCPQRNISREKPILALAGNDMYITRIEVSKVRTWRKQVMMTLKRKSLSQVQLVIKKTSKSYRNRRKGGGVRSLRSSNMANMKTVLKSQTTTDQAQ